MDAILFTHHHALNEPVTRKHLALLRALNHGHAVIPLSFGHSAPESKEFQRHNHDILMWRWFAETNPHYERYFLIEWDCFCTQSLREFFGDSYHKKIVGSQIVRPWSSEPIENEADGFSIPQRQWWWFTQNESADLYPFLRGIVPASVVMFSHDAMFDASQLMLTVPALLKLQCECRLGTLAAMSGREPEPIGPDCQKWISCKDVDIDQGPGIYHRCRA